MNANTPAEIVASWDAGELVPTVEMGGLGPGYEQAIQTLMVELLRSAGEPTQGDWGEAVIDKYDASLGGLSGAQVGAAQNLARAVHLYGMQGVRHQVEIDRRIFVSKSWPRASNEAGGA